MVGMINVSHSAVIGGIYNASKSNIFQAIRVEGSNSCSVRSVRATSNSSLAIISINMGARNEVTESDIGPGPGRCLWTLATEYAFVHHNQIHDCQGHSLDFDAFTGHSVAWKNTCLRNGNEGIFVEETAHDNAIFDNVVQHR